MRTSRNRKAPLRHLLALLALVWGLGGAAFAFTPQEGMEMLWLASDGTSLVGYGRIVDGVLELEVRGDGTRLNVLVVAPDGEATLYAGEVVRGRPRVWLGGGADDLATVLAERGVLLRLRDADGNVLTLAPLQAPVRAGEPPRDGGDARADAPGMPDVDVPAPQPADAADVSTPSPGVRRPAERGDTDPIAPAEDPLGDVPVDPEPDPADLDPPPLDLPGDDPFGPEPPADDDGDDEAEPETGAGAGERDSDEHDERDERDHPHGGPPGRSGADEGGDDAGDPSDDDADGGGAEADGGLALEIDPQLP